MIKFDEKHVALRMNIIDMPSRWGKLKQNKKPLVAWLLISFGSITLLHCHTLLFTAMVVFIQQY